MVQSVFLAAVASILIGGSLVAEDVGTYGPMRQAGTFADPRLDESSGVAASRLHPGQFWTHNDSGDVARLLRFDADGQTTAVVNLPLSKPTDWEDLASFVWKDRPLLLIGDVGDNGARRDFVTLWLLAEQDWSAAINRPHARPIRLDLRYADGPRDCESVAVDPVRGEVMLITKIDPRRDFMDQSAVYLFDLADALQRVREADAAASPSEPLEPLTVERVATLPLKIATGADVSPDGLRCVVNTYGHAFVFTRRPDEAWPAAFARPPRTVTLGPRGQSEAIAFAHDGQGLILTTEGKHKPFWTVEMEPPGVAGESP